MLFKRDLHQLEYDPASQYKFHRFWAIFWFFVLAVIPTMPKLYGHSFEGVIVITASNWANFATHLSGMSSALAAQSSAEKPTRKEIMEKITKIPTNKIPPYSLDGVIPDYND